MAVVSITVTCPTPRARSIRADWAHAGVVSSGDLEVLLRNAPGTGQARFEIRTKAAGFEAVWQAVLERYVRRTGLGDVHADINDNAATPPVVVRRLDQAVANAGGLAEAPGTP